MLLSHAFFLYRWLAPVWTDKVFWAIPLKLMTQAGVNGGYQERLGLYHPSGQANGAKRIAGQGGVRLGEEWERDKRTFLSDVLAAQQLFGETVLVGSPGERLWLESLGGEAVTAVRRDVTTTNDGPAGEGGDLLRVGLVGPASFMGILGLSLCGHDAPMQLLDDWASGVQFLYIVDWAMPERNLDYLCHILPNSLAFFSGIRAFKGFRAAMGRGPEGLVEQYNASQNRIFLRRMHHKKYRWGSIIAVGYGVERIQAGG